MKYLTVVAACIVEGERILICQRKKDDAFALLWEFPGGVVEKAEAFPDAIAREIKEEVGIDIDVIKPLETFDDENEHLHITVHLFLCRVRKGTVQALDYYDFAWSIFSHNNFSNT